ncbi:MAG TPA: acetoacetate decarboxylase family protein [Pseudomonadota bacterium]|nr:acetoacetate decarboxylase family protein [Pseudomonadota bacterium]
MTAAMTGAEIAATVTPPPTPWRMSGRMFMGLFRSEQEAKTELPARLAPLLAGHRVVAVIRYCEGTLRYDELIIGRLARYGRKPGLFVDYIWVDSRESVAGGRRIWGLPKELAEFCWNDDRVTVRDAQGELATLTVNQSPAWLPEVPMRAPGFGQRDGQLLLVPGRLRVRLRGASLRLESLAPRLGRLPRKPWLGCDAVPFTLDIGDARILEQAP